MQQLTGESDVKREVLGQSVQQAFDALGSNVVWRSYRKRKKRGRFTIVEASPPGRGLCTCVTSAAAGDGRYRIIQSTGKCSHEPCGMPICNIRTNGFVQLGSSLRGV